MANFTSTHTGSVVDAAVTKITATSSSATELNILDGVTATTAEINILDGVTATTAEINILDGVTATAAEINILDGVTSTTAELNILDGVTSTAAELNILDGVTSTAAELNVLDGYTGSVTELNYLDTLHATGVTATEFDYLDGVTSNIQTQLDAKIEATLTSEQVQDIVGAMFSSNTESGITVSYEDGDGTIDLTVATQSDNNFTTTLLNKLNAIEASADVTDTTNVTSAGALMDSEVSNLSFVKGLTKGISDGNVLTANDAVADNDFLRIDGTEVEGRTAAEVRSDLNVEDGATADQTASEIKTLVGNASDSNVFTDADHSKLDGIEASADVTDATNVTAAGALMDSELTSIADVKALDQSVISGASPTFGTANMTDASNKRFMTDAQETKLDSVESNATADQTDEEIQDIVGAMFSSNTETGITATYQDADGTIDLVVGTLNQDTTGTASKVTVADSTANTNFPVVFHDEGTGNVLLDDTGALRYNPSTGELLVPKLTVAGTTTQVDTVTMEAANAIIFEGATADAHETTLSIVDPTADHTQYLINQGGYIPVLAAATTTAITSTPAELNVLDGITSTTAELNILDGVTSTAAELNILDGVTATAAELNIMDGVTATTAELNYVDGVTSNIQTQLDATLDTAGTGIDISSTTISVDVSDFMTNGSNDRILTATGTDAMNAEANLTFDGTDLKLLGDDLEMRWGAGQDFKIYVSSDDAYLVNIREDKDIRFMVNDGNGTSGANITALKIDASDVGAVKLPNDNQVLYIGAGNDSYFTHNGTNSIWGNNTGTLQIRNHTSDADMFLSVNDGGSHINAIQIDASNYGRVILPSDNQKLTIGAGYDLNLYNNGSVSYIANSNNTFNIDQGAAATMQIRNLSSDQDITFSVNDGGSQINAIQIDSSEVGQVKLPNDNQRLSLGASDDLDFIHDGSNSIIGNATGDLTIKNFAQDKDIILMSDDGSGGETAYLTLDGSAGYTTVQKTLRLDDNVQLHLGTGNDLKIYHNSSSSNNNIDNHNGSLYVTNYVDDADIIFRSDNGSGGVTDYFYLDGSATKTIFAQSTQHADNAKAGFGAASDLQIYHDGSHNYIDTNNGNIYFRDDADNNIFTVYREGGGIQLSEGDLKIPATSKLYLDGGGNTYIFEESADNVIHYVGGQNKLRFNSTGTILNDAGLALDFRVEGDTDPNLFFVDGSADRVGIGTNSPSKKLEVVGDVRIASGGDLILSDSGGGNDTFLYNDSQSLIGYINGAERFRVNSSGNLGIGTTSPSVELHVKDASSHAQLRIETDNAGSGAYLELEDTTNKYQIYNLGGDLGIDESGVATRFIIKDSTGNIGIGTSSPVAKLDIENSTAPTLDNNTHAGEALFLRSGGSGGDGNVQAVLAFGKADGSSRRSGSAIASVQTDSDVDKVGIGFYTSDSSSSSQTMDQRVLIDHVGNMRFSDNGANPSASTNMAFIFNDGGEMKVLDELGNTTTISPHNFELIPEGASEDMAFAYHSTKHTPEGKLKKVNVDMMKLARLVEQLTGEKLVYIEEGEKDG
jgi:hypothetical protein